MTLSNAPQPTPPQPTQRLTRLVALVSEDEAAQITQKAMMAGQSVSAFLRARALDEEQAQRFDQLVARMEDDLDTAIETMTQALARMEAQDQEAARG